MVRRKRQTDTQLDLALVKRFRATYEGTPSWAWPYMPSIPFIGRSFTPGRGLLIYASAENLSWMNQKSKPRRFTTDHVWNRYRACYEEKGRDSEDFFPDVGIAPVDDGGLLAAGHYVAKEIGLPIFLKPRAFLETIAVSNWCKFSIRTAKNKDYIRDVPKLAYSLPFVVGELALLRPAVVLIHRGVWKQPILRAAMRGACPGAKFIPVPQCNSRVVNIHLATFDRQGLKLRDQLANTPLSAWMNNLCGFTVPNAWRYLALLQTLISPNELTGETWLDGGELSDADKTALDAALADYQKNPDAGSSWVEVKTRIMSKLRP